MSKGVKLVNSGFSFIDKKWGGIYAGGSYLMIGPKKSGRTLLGLQFAHEAVESSEVVLYFTTMRPKDLMIQASSINFDIQSYMNKNLIIVVRVSPPTDAYDSDNPDILLKEYLNDIITVINQYKPKRFIFDELTPYIGFKSLDYLYNSFMSTIEIVEENDITSIFILGEPAEERSKKIINVLSQCVTGQFILSANSEKKNPKSKGIVTISPNVGHTEGEFSEEYFIEPYQGLITSADEKRKPAVQNQTPEENRDENEFEFDNLGFTNLYDYSDFNLLLNNQIAMYKSTGQKFTLLTFKLDPAAQVNGVLSLGQLQTAIRQTVEKKNKICVLENKIMVLIVNNSKDKVKKIVAGLKTNLPSKDENYLNVAAKYISVLIQEISENIENAEQMISLVSGTDNPHNNKFTAVSEF